MKLNYTIRNLLPGTTCDVNLSQTTLFTATMLINNCSVLKILKKLYVLALFPLSITFPFTNLYHTGSVVPGSKIKLHF